MGEDESGRDRGEDSIVPSDHPPPSRTSLVMLRQSRAWPLLLCLTYWIGILWHGLHPFVSVFTGETRPRRLYVDENSADPHYFRIYPNKFKRRDQLVPAQQQRRQQQQASQLPQKPAIPPLMNLCRAVKAVVSVDSFENDQGNLMCRSMHQQAVDVLQITPAAGLTVRSEAIVLVLPASNDWMESPLHSAFLSFLLDLVQPQFTWLAKTVFVLAPRIRPGQTLTTSQTVDVFLEAYLGESAEVDHPGITEKLFGSVPSLPSGLAQGALLRQLLVWDQEVIDPSATSSSTAIKTPTIRLLPQGSRGILPNMDLVSVVRTALQRSVGLNANFEIHPFPHSSQRLQKLLDGVCQTIVTRINVAGITCPSPQNLSALSNMLLFEHALRGHDYRAPHATALERGIDALTIHLVVKSFDMKTRNLASKLPAAMEVSLRALSNLHERLHHSTSLYLLLDEDHFVKHEEYLVPNLLLLLPLIIRAVTLVLVDLEYMDWSTVGLVLERTVLFVVGISFGLEAVQWIDEHSWWIVTDRVTACHAIVCLAYLYIVAHAILSKKTSWSAQSRKSVQLLTCLWGLYVHVAIAFGHVSLAFPSALFWTPLLAFASFDERAEPKNLSSRAFQGLSLVVGPVVFLITLPFVWFVPNLIPSYTPYVCYAYLPLHLMASHLWLS